MAKIPQDALDRIRAAKERRKLDAFVERPGVESPNEGAAGKNTARAKKLRVLEKAAVASGGASRDAVADLLAFKFFGSE